MDVAALILAGLLGGGGLLGAIYNWYTFRTQSHRQSTVDFWDNFERQIKSAEGRGDTAETERLRRKYEEQLEAWRAQQELAQTVHKDLSVAKDESLLSPGEVEQLKRLLLQSKALSPAFLLSNEHFVRGKAHYEAGQYEQALASYDRVIDLNPNNVEALNNRALTLSNLGRDDDALADYNRSLQLRPDKMEILSNRGNALSHLGRYNDALADFTRAFQLHPNHPTIYYNRACMYSLWQKPNEALEDLRRAIDGNEKYRRMAPTDEDLNNIRSDPRFVELVGQAEPPPDATESS